ncbi:MAK10-like protein [Tanacetum coccineum]
MGDENPIRTLGYYSKPSHEGYMNTIELPVGNNVVPLRSDTIRERTRLRLFQFSHLDQASNWLERLPVGSITTWEVLTSRFLVQLFLPGRTAKLRNDILMFQQHHRESLSKAWTRFKDLLQKVPHHGIELWLKNDPRDFAKPVKAIALPQDVPSTSDHRLIKLKNQVQRLMEAHLAPTQPTQVNKITTLCEICSGHMSHDTQYCLEDPEQAFVEYASSRTDEAGGLVSNFMASQDARLSKFEADFKQQQSEMTNKINTVLKAITDRIGDTLPSDTVKNPKLSTTPPDESQVNEPDIEHEEKGNLGNTNSNPHPQPDPLASITTEQVRKMNSMLESIGLVPRSFNTKFVYSKKDDGEVLFIEIIRDDDEPQNEGPNKGEWATMEGRTVEYFDTFPTRGNFTYIVDFMIIEDISSIIDPGLSQVVLGKPFVEISNMTHDPPEGAVRFTDENDEVSYKMPHKIKQYNSLSNLKNEHIKSVYLRNEEDKRRGIDYVMNKILGFYKECLELGPEYVTGLEDKGKFM